jgi:hypothetical protein
LLFLTSGLPTPTYDGALSDKDLLEMRKYARFAGEFSPEQIEQLLRSYDQKEIVVLK